MTTRLAALIVLGASVSVPASVAAAEEAARRDRARAGERRQLILADEPTASLDSERGFKVIGMLKKIAKERGAAVITVTHDERMIQGFDTIRRMKDGRFETAS